MSNTKLDTCPECAYNKKFWQDSKFYGCCEDHCYFVAEGKVEADDVVIYSDTEQGEFEDKFTFRFRQAIHANPKMILNEDAYWDWEEENNIAHCDIEWTADCQGRMESHEMDAEGNCPACVAALYKDFIKDTGNVNNLDFDAFKKEYNMEPLGKNG